MVSCIPLGNIFEVARAPSHRVLQLRVAKESALFQTILLATDGSAAAERASEYAASLAVRYDAQVLVLHALDAPPDTFSEPNDSRALERTLTEAHALVAGIAARLHELGVVDIRTDVIEGPAAEVILAVAKTRGIDLIAIGARGLSLWKSLLLGSISLAVTQRAACPVLVVK